MKWCFYNSKEDKWIEEDVSFWLALPDIILAILFWGTLLFLLFYV